MTLWSTLGRAAVLLFRNPILLVPNIAIGGVAGVLEAVIAPQSPDSLPTSHVQLWLADGVGIVASVIALAVSTGMADGAWRSGRARISDATIAFRRECGHVFVATLAMGLLGYIAAVLAPYTAFLSMFVWVFFSIYTISAAVVGEREGFVALRDSAVIAYRKPLTTFLLIAALSVVVFGAMLAGAALSGVAHVGAIVAAVVTEISIAYLSLATVGEYETLRTV